MLRTTDVSSILFYSAIENYPFSTSHWTFHFQSAVISTTTNIIKQCHIHVSLFLNKTKRIFSVSHWIFHFESNMKSARNNVISFCTNVATCIFFFFPDEPELETGFEMTWGWLFIYLFIFWWTGPLRPIWIILVLYGDNVILSVQSSFSLYLECHSTWHLLVCKQELSFANIWSTICHN